VLDYLIDLTSRLGHWGYLVIFLGAMLESAAFLGVLVPGESLVLVAGFIAAQGLLDIGDLILVVAIGAILGDSIGYELGRLLGRPWLLRYGRRVGVKPARLDHVDAFFARHGGKAVFLGRFVGFARALVPFIAGSSRMRYRLFLPYNALGAVLWSVAVVLLGYFLGASWQLAERWMGRASAILGGLLLFILGLAWLWRWAARHEARVKEGWKRLLDHPRVVAFGRRFAPQIAFIHARLSPTGSFGLNLTLGALILIGAGWLFGGVAEDVVSGDPLTVVDAHVAAWFHAHAVPMLTHSMLLITHLHGIWGIIILSLMLASFLTWKREWDWLLALVLVEPGGILLNVLTKYAFGRARPSFDEPILTLTTYSFPSGHVAGSTLFYGLLAAFIVTRVEAWRWRVLVALLAFLIVAMVALSRVYLGVHYLSDVLAALAESIAWLTLCLTAIHTWRSRRGDSHYR
jgi:membrane protein DedA with SNARE-associated domain/membrane-associated phospholipid phosphatase